MGQRSAKQYQAAWEKLQFIGALGEKENTKLGMQSPFLPVALTTGWRLNHEAIQSFLKRLARLEEEDPSQVVLRGTPRRPS